MRSVGAVPVGWRSGVGSRCLDAKCACAGRGAVTGRNRGPRAAEALCGGVPGFAREPGWAPPTVCVPSSTLSQRRARARAIHWRYDFRHADYGRAHVTGGTYFFTVNTYRRAKTFLTDADVRLALREAIGTLRLTHPFVIEALLPDHRHGPLDIASGDGGFLPPLACRQTHGHVALPNEPQSTWDDARRRKEPEHVMAAWILGTSHPR